MIKTEKMVPEVYYNKSRDFQVLGRAYDIISNYMKMNSDLVRDNTISINNKAMIIDLICSTLGFKVKHEYNNKQLIGLCSIYMLCMKNKGTIKAIKLVLDLLTHIENSDNECVIEYDPNDPNSLNIFIPNDIKDITLFKDVLNYFMPAGLIYQIRHHALIEKQITTSIELSEDVVVSKVSEKRSGDIMNSDIITAEQTSNLKEDNKNI